MLLLLLLLQVRELFEELVVPFVMSHEGMASVLLGGKKGKTAVPLSEEDVRDKLWQVCWRHFVCEEGGG